MLLALAPFSLQLAVQWPAVATEPMALSCKPGWVAWTGLFNSDWFNSFNWSPMRVPSPIDVACITNSAHTPVRIATGSTAEVNQLVTSQPVTVSAGVLQLDSAMSASDVQGATFTLSGGALQGAGSLMVSSGGTLHWSGPSTITGTGTTEIASGSTLTVDSSSSSGTRTLRGGRILSLDNGATGTWGGSDLISSGESAVVNMAGTLTMNCVCGWEDFGGMPSLLHVLPGGTLSQAGANPVDFQIPVENDGLIEAPTGSIALQGGSGAGSDGGNWTAGLGSVISLQSGSFTIGGGAVSGSGSMGLDTPDQVDVTGTFAVQAGGTLVMTDGALGGAGSIVVDGLLRLDATTHNLTLTGGGATEVATGGVLALEASQSGHTVAFRGGRALDIEAGASGTWSGPLDLSSGEGATVNVAGTLTAESDRAWSNLGGAAPLLRVVAGGSLTKGCCGGSTSVAIPLENNGTVQADPNSGTLSFSGGSGGSSDTGNWSAGAAGAIQFSGGTHTLAGGNLSGAGVVRVTGGETDLTVPFTVPAGMVLEVAGGTLGGAGALTVGGTLHWSGDSTMTGAATTEIAGGGALSIDDGASGGTRTLRGGRALSLDPAATGTWSGADDISSGEGSVVTLGGALTVANDRTWKNLGGAAPLLHVLGGGSLTKSAGPGTSFMQIPFTNDGTVASFAGTVDLAGGFSNYDTGTHTLTGGIYSVSGGSVLQFTGADVHTNASTITLDGVDSRLADQAGNNGLRNLSLNEAGATLTLRADQVLNTSAGLTTRGTFGIALVGPSPGKAPELQATGASTLAGTLALTTSQGFVPPLGQAYTIMSYPSQSGKFAAITGQAIPASDLAYAVTVGANAITLTVKHSADLSVSGAAPHSAPAGSMITYTETVHDGGPGRAGGVKLVDTLPSGATLDSASSSQGTCTKPPATKIVCKVGAMAFGGPDVTITIVVTTPNTPNVTITNKESVTTTDVDLNTKNNKATQKTKLT